MESVVNLKRFYKRNQGIKVTNQLKVEVAHIEQAIECIFEIRKMMNNTMLFQLHWLVMYT